MDVGEVKVAYTADTRGLEAGADRAADAVTAAAKEMADSLDEVKAEFASTGEAAGEAGDAVQEAAKHFAFASAAQAGISSLESLRGATAAFRDAIHEAGREASKLRSDLRATFGGAAEDMAKLAEQKIVLGFDQDQATEGLQILERFKMANEATFARVVDASKAARLELSQVAENYSRFKEFGEESFLTTLQEDLGITSAELAKYGAAVDGANKVLLDTPDRVAAAKAALDSFMDAEFTGSLERSSSELQKLTGELDQLKREVGLGTIELQEKMAPAARLVVAGLNEMPALFKTAIGVAAEFVSVGTSVAAGGLQIAANMALVTSNAGAMAAATTACSNTLGVLRVGVAAMAGPLGIVIGLVGASAVVFAAWTLEMQKANAASEDLLRNEEKRAEGLRRNKDLIGQTGEQLKANAKTMKEITEVILGLQDQIEAARRNGNKAAEEKLVAQLREAKKARAELGKLTEAETKKKPPEKSVEDQKKERDEAARQAEEKRKEDLAVALDGVRSQAAAGKINKEQQRALLQEILDDFKAHNKIKASEARALAMEIATIDGQLLDQQKKAAEKASKDEEARAKVEADQVRKAGQERLKIEADNLSGRQKQAEEDLGEDGALEKAQSLARQRLAVKIKEINAERDATLEGAKGSQARAEIINTAEAEIRAAREATGRELESLAERDKKAMDARAKAATDAANKEAAEARKLRKDKTDADKSVLETEMRQIEQTIGKDSKAVDKLADLLRERLELQIEEIRAIETAEAAAAASEENKAAASEAAEAKIRAARKTTDAQFAAFVKKHNDEIQKVADKAAKVSAQVAKSSQVGGKASPVYTDPSEGIGIKFSEFVFNELKKPGSKPEQDKIDPAKPLDAESIADAVGKRPNAITVQINQQGRTATREFSGTADELNRTQNVWNPEHSLT